MILPPFYPLPSQSIPVQMTQVAPCRELPFVIVTVKNKQLCWLQSSTPTLPAELSLDSETPRRIVCIQKDVGFQLISSFDAVAFRSTQNTPEENPKMGVSNQTSVLFS